MTIREAYGILGVDAAGAPPDGVRAAFKKAALRTHPDRVQGSEADRNRANDAMVRLNLAFECIEASGFPRLAPEPPPRQETFSQDPPRQEQPHREAPSGTRWHTQGVDVDIMFQNWRRTFLRQFSGLNPGEVWTVPGIAMTRDEAYVLLRVDPRFASPGIVRNALYRAVMQAPPVRGRPRATDPLVRLIAAYEFLESERFPRAASPSLNAEFGLWRSASFSALRNSFVREARTRGVVQTGARWSTVLLTSLPFVFLAIAFGLGAFATAHILAGTLCGLFGAGTFLTMLRRLHTTPLPGR